jgi:hypothetical protein
LIIGLGKTTIGNGGVAVAHCPALGVKIYVPLMVLLTVAGFQVPVIPLIEVVDKIGAVAPLQIGAIGRKLGVILGVTVTLVVVLLQVVVVFVKVNVTAPALIPVITPALLTVAIALLLLVQVPPVVGLRVAVLPKHTAVGAVNIGSAFTVTLVVVLLQVVAVFV